MPRARTRARRRPWAAWAACAACVGWVGAGGAGCGEPTRDTATTRSMGATAPPEAGGAPAPPTAAARAAPRPPPAEAPTASFGNRPPRLLGIQVEPADRVVPGTPVRVSVQADDPDGDPLETRFEWWLNGEVTEATGASFATGDLRQGDALQVRVQVSDGRVESVTLQSPELPVDNAPPRILSRPGDFAEDGSFRYPLEAEDPEGDPDLRFLLLEGPRGMRLEPDGELVWTPGEGATGRHPVRIAVEDSRGARQLQVFEIDFGAAGEVPAAPAP